MPVIKGAQVVEAMGGRITKQVEELKNAGVEPCLAILRVGEDRWPMKGVPETGSINME